jgi:signal transduction histidine kinase/DNA-binding response OmpR family regulator
LQPPPGFRPATRIANHDLFFERVRRHETETNESDQPIVSEMERVDVTYAGSQQAEKTNVVWAGIHLTPREPGGRHVVVIAAMNLDAKPPRVPGEVASDDRSPLSRMNGSPRHLAVLANEPTARASGSTKEATATPDETDGESAAVQLVYPYDETFQLLRREHLEPAFRELYRGRKALIEKCQKLKPELEPRDVLSSPGKRMELQRPVWFLQSAEIRKKDDRQAVAAVLVELARADHSGQRIGLMYEGVKNIRLLAIDRKQVLALAETIDRRLSARPGGAPAIHVRWQKPVQCQNCYVSLALFPVRSADAEGGRRYYGLAQAAFQDEMAADVWDKLYGLFWWGIAIVLSAAGLAFACSLVFTRPLKQITATAQAVADANIDVDPAKSAWRKSVSSIVDRLPVKRHDEIGVLARTFRQMLQEVMEGQERLRKWNVELEQRVKERTVELEQANEELKVARDKAQELNRAKDAFLASVSHELRNPLNQVSGFCQLLEMTDLDNDQRADLEKIRAAGSQLLTLINDILDYQKIIMGGITLEPEEIAVPELVRQIGEAMAFPARDNGNQLEVHCDDRVPALYADEQRVRQVLLNLVGNACKLTHDGSVRLQASLEHEGERPVVRFDVIDTGRGMKPEEMAKLFRPFVKLSSKQGNRSGTGLGLVICKGFCDMMHGDISVQSVFGKGSTFTVRLPADTTQGPSVAPPATADKDSNAAPPEEASEEPTGEAETAEPARAKAAAVKHPRPPRQAVGDLPADKARMVLVVDDDPGVREMMHRYLEMQGFYVITAASGLEGLEMAKRLRPAVITLDAVMPGLDGWAVLAALRTDAETRDIPVIMVTISDEEQRGFSLGAAEFVSKPVDWEKLAGILAGFTGNKRDRSILVVDDEPEAREILRRNLEHDGWTVIEAEHGQAALRLLASEKPAAILLDLMMPVMDGFEFLAQYCQLAEWLSVPVVVVTAKDPAPEELERLEGLVVRVLHKGQYSHEDLLREIHRRVDRHIQFDKHVAKEEHDAPNISG